MPPANDHPGVYVEADASPPPAVLGVPTDIALFVGWSPRGPVSRAVRISSFGEFVREFGGLHTGSPLGYAVGHFFENGGGDARVMRLTSAAGGPQTGVAADDYPLDPADERFHRAVLAAFGPGSPTSRIKIFNLVCVPGLTHVPTIAALQRCCRQRRAFLLVDSARDDTVETVRQRVPGLAGPDAMNSAVYFSWLVAPDPMQAGVQRPFPPSGFVAGVYARTDRAHGVWRAPAGPAGAIASAARPAVAIDDAENGVLNGEAVNCIRSFAGRGTVVWGARTLHGQNARASEWKYVPVRRLALYLEESIDRGTRWALAEPNDERLWARVRWSVDVFMQGCSGRARFKGRRRTRRGS